MKEDEVRVFLGDDAIGAQLFTSLDKVNRDCGGLLAPKLRDWPAITGRVNEPFISLCFGKARRKGKSQNKI